MSTSQKTLLTAFCVLITAAILMGVIRMIDGNYLANASFITSGLIALAIVAVLYGIVKAMKRVWLPCLLLSFAALQSCNYAKSNQQVVVSDDCGMKWKKIKPGDAVPKGVGNACYMKVVIPNFPMQGDSRFITNLKDRVRASVHIDYDYSIVEPLAFIKQAKYLGKANKDADDVDAVGAGFEGAENMVIDKRIRDVSKSMFITQDIVELDQADLENDLLVASNKVLEPLGVHLNFITLTFDLDEQTRQAIDISTAMKVYESKNLVEVGKQVMVSRAGAPKIIVENKYAAPVRGAEEEE